MNNDRTSLSNSCHIHFVAKLYQGRSKTWDPLVGPGGEVKLVDLTWPVFALNPKYILKALTQHCHTLLAFLWLFAVLFILGDTIKILEFTVYSGL